LEGLYEKVECGLIYIGSSAIEDKLQDRVPDTIKVLMSANIKVWVLTGDKQGTAIEIGKSCNLIGGDIDHYILSEEEQKDGSWSVFETNLEQATMKVNAKPGTRFGLVVDGKTLAKIL
jgi:phospholipid-transporting ATPase